MSFNQITSTSICIWMKNVQCYPCAIVKKLKYLYCHWKLFKRVKYNFGPWSWLKTPRWDKPWLLRRRESKLNGSCVNEVPWPVMLRSMYYRWEHNRPIVSFLKPLYSISIYLNYFIPQILSSLITLNFSQNLSSTKP